MTGVLFDIDGVPTPAKDCDWQMLAPCGCVVGLSVIERLGGVVADSERAMREFWPTARERKQKAAEGYTARLGLRSEGVRLFRLECPHKATGDGL